MIFYIMKSTSQHYSTLPTMKFRSVRYRFKSTHSKEVSDVQKISRANHQKEIKQEKKIKIGATQSQISGTFRVKRKYSIVENQSQLQGTPNIMTTRKPLKLNSLQNTHSSEAKQNIQPIETKDWEYYSRINLPVIEDQNINSHFTVLDPFLLQAKFIQTLVDQTHRSLQANRQMVEQTTAQLQRIPSIIGQKLQQIKALTLSKIEQFSKSLKKESVEHHESVLRARQQMQQIASDFRRQACLLDRCLNQTQDAQLLIFQGLPFELVENQDEIQPFAERLF